MDEEVKYIIEENPLAVSTVRDGKPHNAVVAFAKIKDDKIVITANYLTKTLENLKNNPEVSIVVWDEDWAGYRITGMAKFYDSGEWYDYVKSLEENEDEPCKGAVVVDVGNVEELE